MSTLDMKIAQWSAADKKKGVCRNENVLFEEKIGEKGLSFYECVCVVYVISFYFGEWNKLVSRTNGTEIGWKWSK